MLLRRGHRVHEVAEGNALSSAPFTYLDVTIRYVLFSLQ